MKDISDFLDLGDRWVLPVSIFLLIVPLIGILALYQAGPHKTDFSGMTSKALVERKSAFKISRDLLNSPGSVLSPVMPAQGGNSGLSPIDRELTHVEEIFRSYSGTKSKPGESWEFHLGSLDNPKLAEARNMLERGNPAEAEKFFLLALEAEPDNPFLAIAAWGDLCRIYGARKNKEAYQNAFRKYMAALAALPADSGLPLPDNFQLLSQTLKSLQDEADPALLRQELTRPKSGAENPGSSPETEQALKDLDEISITSDGLLGSDSVISR